MNKDEFFQYAIHADNLDQDALDNLNWEEIEKLSADTPIIQQALRMWSQFIVGNVSGTTEELMTLPLADRKRVLQIFLAVTGEPDGLRDVANLVVEVL